MKKTNKDYSIVEYSAPDFDVIEVQAEAGFAITGETEGEDSEAVPF